MWAAIASAAIQYSPWALNAQGEAAYRKSWMETHDKMRAGFNAEDSMRTAEKNLSKIQSDRQLTLTDQRTAAAITAADDRVAIAASGTTGSLDYVGKIANTHANQAAVDKINAEYGSRLQGESEKLKSSAYDFYALNQPYKSQGFTKMDFLGRTK